MRVSGGPVEAGGTALALKFGLFKLAAGLAAVLGAFLMAAVLEPKSKREMVLRALVALGTSMLATGWVVRVAAAKFGVDIDTMDLDERIEYTLAAAGLIGAVSWFVLGAAGEVLKMLRRDPAGTLRWLRGAGARPTDQQDQQ